MRRSRLSRSLRLLASLPVLGGFLLAPPAASPQSETPEMDRAAAGWDEFFRTTEIPEIDPQTSFAARCVRRLLDEKRLAPGASVLDLGTGDGRNAVYLAGLGLAVTGIDISEVGLEKARRSAAERGVRIETIRADLFQHDLGRESWDLVVNIYFNPSIFFFHRVKAAVRPGGFLLVEGYGSDYEGLGPQLESRYRPNQLLAELAGWRILEYQDGVFPSQWGEGGSAAVVRILAQKPDRER